MHQYKGKLIIHTGSMFSGKTSSLEKDVNRFRIAKYRTIAIKPRMDLRYSDKEIVSHDQTTLSAMAVDSIEEIAEIATKQSPDVMAIDELQFIGGDAGRIVEVIEEMLDRQITVIVAGLDMDFTGAPFEAIKELMPLADYLTKHHAVCASCGTDAWVSHRKTKATERVVLGALGEYEPLCRSCYQKERAKEKAFVHVNQVSFIEEK